MSTSSSEELNLVPYLDIMMNLVIFLIVSASLVVPMRDVPVTVPGKTSGAGNPQGLTVAVTTAGLTVLDSAGRTDLLRDAGTGRLPFAALTTALRAYKGASTERGTLTLVADRGTPYSEVVGTVDAARKDQSGELYGGIVLDTAQ